MARQEKKETDSVTYEKQKELKATQQKVEKLERQIARLEKEIKEIDFELEIEYDKTIAQPNFFDHYQKKKKDLEDFMETWEQLQSSLE